MVTIAPRYHPRLIRALRSLDDRRQPIAEICRRAGDVADRLGVTRPSYVHVRRLVLAERARRDAARALVDAWMARLPRARRRVPGAAGVRPTLLVRLREPHLVALWLCVTRPARAGPTA